MNDMIVTTPTAILVSNYKRRNVTPVITEIKDGDDVTLLIANALGGDQDIVDQELDEMDNSVQCIRRARRGDLEVSVFAHPEAADFLRAMVETFERDMAFMKVLQEMGLLGETREDGCMCGHCPIEDEEDQPKTRTVH